MLSKCSLQTLVGVVIIFGCIANATQPTTQVSSSSCRNLFLSAEYIFAFELMRALADQDCDAEIRGRARKYLRSSAVSDHAILVGADSFVRICLEEPGWSDSEKALGARAVIHELVRRRDEVQRATQGLPESDEYRIDLPAEAQEGHPADFAEQINQNNRIKEGVLLRDELETLLMKYDAVLATLRDHGGPVPESN